MLTSSLGTFWGHGAMVDRSRRAEARQNAALADDLFAYLLELVKDHGRHEKIANPFAGLRANENLFELELAGA